MTFDRKILTHGGMMFDLGNPEQSVFGIEDIAHALSNICRFAGHTWSFYSVAQHSVYVSRLVPPEQAMSALLHDAAEAFIGDVSKPLKAMLPDYQAIEARVESAVLAKFGLPPELPECVKEADMILLATERRDLMPWQDEDWPSLKGVEPMKDRIIPVTPTIAKDRFLLRYCQINNFFQTAFTEQRKAV